MEWRRVGPRSGPTGETGSNRYTNVTGTESFAYRFESGLGVPYGTPSPPSVALWLGALAVSAVGIPESLSQCLGVSVAPYLLT